MARRHQYINPLSMGLLGGLGAGFKELEKYNLLDRQNQARQEAYKTKYAAMADVANLRAQNNAMIAKLKAELPQKQYTQVKTDPDSGEKYVSMGHMIADPQNPDRFVPHEDTRMSIDEYNKFKGGGRTTGNGAYTLSPGQKRLDASGNVIAENPKGADPQAAIADRQAAREKAIDARQSKAEQRRIASEAARSTNAAMREFDKATPEEQAALAKSMGISPTVPDPDAKGFFGTPKEGATKPNDALRKQYHDAVHKQALEESAGSSAEGTPSAETGDTTSEPKDDVPDIRTGKDGKQYKIMGTNPDGTIRAVPLAMHDAEQPDDNATAMAGPDDEENEPSPDSEPDEGEGDLGGLIDQYARQSDAAMAQNQNAIGADEDMPEEEDQGLLTG